MAGYELTPEEIKLFLEEAYEQLQIMEETLIALEEDPHNAGLIQEIFRAAHTLKGGSATAGFDNAARLTHAMESLLDLVRQGEREMGPELADPLLQGVDLLRRCLDAVARDGDSESVDVTTLISALELQMYGTQPEPEPEAEAEGVEAPSSEGGAKSSEAAAGGETDSSGGIEIEIGIAPDAGMPSVRAYQVLLALDDLSEIVSCEPDRQVIEQGAGDLRRFRAVVATDVDLDTIRHTIMAIPDIASVVVTEAGSKSLAETTGKSAGSETNTDGAPGIGTATQAATGAGTGAQTSTGAGVGSSSAPSSAPSTGSASAAGASPAASGTSSASGASAPSGTSSASSASANRTAKSGGDSGNHTSFGNTIRVDVALLDNLMNLVGELVIDRTRLAQLSTGEININLLKEELSGVSNSLSRITTDLQDSIMQARMMPVDTLFKRFPRMIRDLSRQLGKVIDFEMSGNETELDRSVIELIGDPLIHLLRNAIDHGIEPAEERRRVGKSERGKVRLRAYHQENHIYIEVSDDGRGLNPQAILRKVVDRGLLRQDEASRLSREQLLEYIFAPGFSTATEVSAVSGRGVGMDVVKRNLEKVNGSVSVTSDEGHGTTFTIKLPLTLVIVQALMVEIAGCVMAIPLSNVTEAVHITSTDVHRASGWEMIAVRDVMVPLLNPHSVWGDEWSVAQENGRAVPVVILRSGASPLGLKVDRLLGEQEIVIKAMGPVVGDVPGVSGASILGDGRVALIVDPAGLSKAVKESA